MSANPKLASIGVNAVGYLRGGLGLGQAARLYVEALHAAGVPVRTTTVDVDLPSVVGADGQRAQVKTTDFADLHVDGELPFNLVCVNAPELPALYERLGSAFFESRHTIGVWAWEVDVVPASWDAAFGLVDEIWVYSRYTQEILSQVSPVPVVCVPLPIVAPAAGADITGLDIPDGFAFLFLFDFYSTLARKNPLGLVEAFTRAFAPGEGPQLVLKSHNGDFQPERLARLRAAAGDRPDIHIVDRFLSAGEMAALMRRADCYVSLHRAEGFGLTLGESMALGKPVIATAFSANLDFMTEENSYLVRYAPAPVGPGGENYPAHGTWAEPDLDHAAQLMRAVWEDQAEASARGARGRQEIAEHFSLEMIGRMARDRLKRLAAGHRRRERGTRIAAAGGVLAGGGLMNSWVETAELKLSFDPQRDARATGGAKGAARRAALSAMRPYTHHQDELSRFTVNGLRELAERLDDLALDTQAAIARRPADGHGLRFDRAIADGGAAPLDDRMPFAGAEWVLDLGGTAVERLDALAAAGIGVRGVCDEESIAARAREHGHDVQVADRTTYLRSLDDASVPAMLAAHVVERLGAAHIGELLELMRRKLAPGGVAVLEVANPHSLAGLEVVWADTAQRRPVFPEALLALCQAAGFQSGEVRFAGDDAHLSPDYALIARA